MNLNYFWNFGSLAGLCLVLQLITGIFLAMHYVSNADTAFNSVEHIMRDVNKGWLLRYLHANGASFFFFVVYIHIFRGLHYISFIMPRHLLWCSGVIILLIMIRATLPRYRYDQLMQIGWKFILPLSLGFLIFYFGLFLFFYLI